MAGLREVVKLCRTNEHHGLPMVRSRYSLGLAHASLIIQVLSGEESGGQTHAQSNKRMPRLNVCVLPPICRYLKAVRFRTRFRGCYMGGVFIAVLKGVEKEQTDLSLFLSFFPLSLSLPLSLFHTASERRLLPGRRPCPKAHLPAP